jgi:hypothetical protein
MSKEDARLERESDGQQDAGFFAERDQGFSAPSSGHPTRNPPSCGQWEAGMQRNILATSQRVPEGRR